MKEENGVGRREVGERKKGEGEGRSGEVMKGTWFLCSIPAHLILCSFVIFEGHEGIVVQYQGIP